MIYRERREARAGGEVTGRTVKAKYAGQSYAIPDIWLAGFCSSHGCSVLDALAYWHSQAELEKAWQAQQRVAE